MEGTAQYAPVIDLVAERTDAGSFTLVDIGCSGGIDQVWRKLRTRLRAIGFDANLFEIRRLKDSETHPDVRYVAGLAALPPDHPFAVRKGDRSNWGRNPWDRLSIVRTREILAKETPAQTESQMIAANLWTEMELADEQIVIPDFLRTEGVSSVDFLKIDIDGKDLDVLHSFDAAFDELQILGAGLEVNYHGSAADTDHTFHNTDRFMKEKGFELFDLSVRRYSVAALPSANLITMAAQTRFGRPLQGDALYVRDVVNPEFDEFASRLAASKLLNVLTIFAVFDLPDCAAEVALRFRDRLEPLCDIERVLDLLAAQAQGEVRRPLSYREYMKKFEENDPMFWPS